MHLMIAVALFIIVPFVDSKIPPVKETINIEQGQTLVIPKNGKPYVVDEMP